MSDRFRSNRFIFRWALWRAAGKGKRQGKITRDGRRLIRGVLKNPIRNTPIGGQVDLCDALQGACESKMMNDAKTEEARFDFWSLITILLEMLPQLLEWIRDLLDRLDDDEDADLA